MRALKEAFAKVGIESVPGAIGAVFAYGVTVAVAAWLFGLEVVRGYFEDGVVLITVAALSFPVFFLWKFISIPAVMDAEKDAQITAISAERDKLLRDGSPQEIASLKAQVARLEAEPEDRVISSEQGAAFKAAYDTADDWFKAAWVLVRPATGDAENHRYAQKIIEMIKGVGFDVSQGPDAVAERGERGLVICYAPGDIGARMAQEFVTMFTAANFDVSSRAMTATRRSDETNIEIVVAPQRRPTA